MSDPKNVLRNLGGVVDSSPVATSLPAVPPTDDRGLFSFLTSIKQWITNATTGSNRLVTVGDLVTAGAATTDAQGNVAPKDQTDYSTPPAPIGIVVAGNTEANMVTWQPPTGYKNMAYAEIWRGTAVDMADAAFLGVTASAVYVDQLTSAGPFYYQVRYVSKAGIYGPWNAPYGTGVTDTLTGNAYVSNLWTSNLVFDKAIGNTFSANVINGDSIWAKNLGAVKASLGTVTLDSDGWLKTNGVSGYGSGTGVFLGYDTDNYKFRIGDTTDQYVKWDGANLSIKSPGLTLENGNATFSGDLSGATGTFSGQLQGATGTFNGTLMAGVLDMSFFGGFMVTVYPGSGVDTDHTKYAVAGTNVTYAVPSGYNSVRVTTIGGGGGGGSGGAAIYRTTSSGDKNQAGGGGGGGGEAGAVTTQSIVFKNGDGSPIQGCAVTVTIGAGGAAGGSGNGTTISLKNSSGTLLGSVYSAGGNPGARGGDATTVVGNYTVYAGTGGAGGTGTNGADGNSGGTGSVWNNKSGSELVPGGYGGTGGSTGYPGGYGAGGTGAAGNGITTTYQIPGAAATGGSSGMVYLEFFNDKIVVLRDEYDTLKAAHNALCSNLGKSSFVVT